VSGGGGPGQGDQRVPDWLLERLAAGELDEARAVQVKGRLEREEGGLGRLAALEISNREILGAHPPGPVAAEVNRRWRRKQTAPRRGPGAILFALPVVGAAAIMAVYVGRAHPPVPSAVDDQTRIKGGVVSPRIRVYRKEGEKVRLLVDGALVRPRDTVQVAYLAGGRRYGAVLSVDGRGVVTLHLPEQPGDSPVLATRGETALPHAYELDAAPGFERFVFVTAARPFRVQEIASALQQGKPLPAGMDQAVLTVRKEAP
jgi:hypothetical protein